tara:strand:+ start:216 stop:446 length:231 start_codon:yes stop_codon:yes gene_type:complete
MKVTKLRSLLKTFSWRVVGTLDTMFLGWLVTGSTLIGLKIGAMELITKFVLYYFHERIWLKCKFGTKTKDISAKSQ